MTLKESLRMLCPPIIWSAARRMVRTKGVKSASAAASEVLISDGRFTVGFSQVSLEGSTYFVPKYAQSRPASRGILTGNLYERDTHELVSKILIGTGGNMVHAGTFFGDMVPTFSKACAGWVYAFEPVLENYVLARLGVITNDLDNVLLFNAGLSDEIGIARVATGGDKDHHHGGSSYIAETGQLTSLMTIDSLQIENLAIIQLDVEGHELNALRGAEATIRANSPLIMIEDNEQTCQAFLGSLGYESVTSIPGLDIWASRGDDRFMKYLTR